MLHQLSRTVCFFVPFKGWADDEEDSEEDGEDDKSFFGMGKGSDDEDGGKKVHIYKHTAVLVILGSYYNSSYSRSSLG